MGWDAVDSGLKVVLSAKVPGAVRTNVLGDVDDPGDSHLVKDYGLSTKSIVVSEVKGGLEVRWKNLEQRRRLPSDPESFQSYVERKVPALLVKP